LVADGSVRTGEVVVDDERLKGFEALLIRGVGTSVGPFTLKRLDERLGLAVGLGTEGTSLLERDAVLPGDIQEEAGAVALGIVCQYSLDRYSALGESEDRALRKASRRRRLLIWQVLDVDEAAVVIDRDMDEVMATLRSWTLLPAPPDSANPGSKRRPPPSGMRPRRFTSRWTRAPGWSCS
jgi:hypothetical protein